MMPVIGKDLDTNTKLDAYHMMKENNVNQLTETALQAVNENSFTVKNPEGVIEDIAFDYGFVCLGMRAEISELPNLEEYAQEKDIKLLNIGDSVRARRIINGTEEGRNIVKTLEVMGAFR